jgi:predicted ATPase
VYTFKHALVQDAAYDSLLKSRRQELHTKIARVIEQRFPSIKTTEPEMRTGRHPASVIATRRRRTGTSHPPWPSVDGG